LPKHLSNDRKELNKEKGSVVILVAVSLTVLLGLAALVTDLGVLYVKHTHLQSALDAAVLAGAQDLPQDTALARQTATEYAATNGLPQITVNITNNNLKISASAQEQVPTFFAKIWGIDENTITASAAAVTVPPSGMEGLVPFGLLDQDLDFDRLYDLKVGANNDADSVLDDSGWFGALDFPDLDLTDGLGGATNYANFIENGYPASITLGQTLHVEHGVMSGPTKTAVTLRMAANRLVYIPIVTIIEASGDSIIDVQVVGFAAFLLEGVTKNGNESFVRGHFVETMVFNGQESGSNSDLQDNIADLEDGTLTNKYGLYAVKLVS
jgi:hypothetical protein